MDNIIEPNDFFDFSSISLAHPVGIQGGAYFTKIESNKKPLYIQTFKSLTRQGFVKTGKKYYCDLMFDANSEVLIHWFENLEERCKHLIYEKKDTWFQSNLEESDIESAFNPLIRVYKSGKFYLLRTNIKNGKDDLPSLKIYDENEIKMEMSEITPETEIISILDIQGIKFTSRNFQIEIEMKQVMVINNEPIFESCLIKTNKKNTKDSILKDLSTDLEITSIVQDEATTEATNEAISEATNEITDEVKNEVKNEVKDEVKEDLEELAPIDIEKDTAINIEFEDLSNDTEENNDVLREINNHELHLDNVEQITLKKPNQVYFELYKEARNKAKTAKKNAILAYLEAKNIKKTYMIENMNDSDSDFDAEINDVSESELEGL